MLQNSLSKPLGRKIEMILILKKFLQLISLIFFLYWRKIHMILNTSWLKLSTQAAKSHSCRSSSDLYAEAFALSCFYKKAYILFDMIGFENCLLKKISAKIRRSSTQRQQSKI